LAGQWRERTLHNNNLFREETRLDGRVLFSAVKFRSDVDEVAHDSRDYRLLV
jgi:hypothetical protein